VPGFEAISRAPQVSLSISAQIVAAIGAGDYPPGAKLPPEAELARQFGVSRPSVREALAALQFAGYIESRKGYGSVIVRTSANMLSDPPIPPSAGSGREAVEVVENRLLVEPYALAVAAADPDRVALGEAHELIQGMRLAVDEPQLHVSTDVLVHKALLLACRNRVLRAEAAQLVDRCLEVFWPPVRVTAWSSSELPHVWADQHLAVWEAIDRGDPQAARAASVEHMRSVVQNMAAAMPDRPGVLRGLEAVLSRFDALAALGPSAIPPTGVPGAD
jgi:DNA-binding FadR family transcriptional regulator